MFTYIYMYVRKCATYPILPKLIYKVLNMQNSYEFNEIFVIFTQLDTYIIDMF